MIRASGASSVVMLGFAFAKESAPIELVGTVSGIANMGNMLAGTIMQPLIGIMLDAMWRGAVADGIRLYDLAAWQLLDHDRLDPGRLTPDATCAGNILPPDGLTPPAPRHPLDPIVGPNQQGIPQATTTARRDTTTIFVAVAPVRRVAVVKPCILRHQKRHQAIVRT